MGEARYIRKDGGLAWVRLTFSIQRDADGRALHYITVAQDINARKCAAEPLAAALEALRTSEQRYRTIFQMSIDAVAISRLSDGVYVDANKVFLDIVGYTRPEVIGRSSLELGIWANAGDRLGMLAETCVNSPVHNLETRFRKKNGDEFPGFISVSVIEIDGESCVLSVSRDVSEAKAAEERLPTAIEALRASERRYRTVFQTCTESIMIHRLDDGTCINVIRMFLGNMGFERDEVMEKPPWNSATA